MLLLVLHVGLQGSIKNPFGAFNDGVALRISNPFADIGVFEVVCTDRVAWLDRFKLVTRVHRLERLSRRRASL